MYVLVPMPCLFFGGGSTQFLTSRDGGGWVLNKTLYNIRTKWLMSKFHASWWHSLHLVVNNSGQKNLLTSTLASRFYRNLVKFSGNLDLKEDKEERKKGCPLLKLTIFLTCQTNQTFSFERSNTFMTCCHFYHMYICSFACNAWPPLNILECLS